MKAYWHKAYTGGLLALIVSSQMVLPSVAQAYYYRNPYYGYYNPYPPTVLNRHPILSGTLIGGAVGAAGGAVVGVIQQKENGGSTPDSSHLIGSSLGKDTAIGAGAGAALGAGVGLIRNKQITGYWF